MASVAQSSSFCLFCAKRSKVKEAESCFNFTTPINSQWAWKSSKFWELPRILAEKAMATHSSTLAWKIPWTEEPGRLQSMGSLESDITKQLHFHFSFSCIGEGNGNPLQCFCLENLRDGGELGGLPSTGSHRVGHDWSDLAAAAAHFLIGLYFLYWEAWAVCIFWKLIPCQSLLLQIFSPFSKVYFFLS